MYEMFMLAPQSFDVNCTVATVAILDVIFFFLFPVSW